MAARAEEAAKLMKEGEKHVSKGFFKKPKWDDGADCFQKAAMIYSNIGDVENGKKASNAAADAHSKAGNLYHAATALENLATFLKNQNREHECAEVYVNAARYYSMANKPQNQADSLAKAARCCKAEQTPQAIEWMQDGIQALEDAERWHVVKEPYRALVILQVRAGLLVEAVATEKKFMSSMDKAQFPEMGAKIGLEIVILLLQIGDFVLAEREFQELSGSGFGFPHTPEQAIAYDLIDASEQRDQQRLTEAGKDQKITFLIPDIARMAKKLKVPSGAAPPRKTVASVGAAAAAAGGEADADGAAAYEDEEDVK